MTHHRVSLGAGDGIRPEVVASAQRVLEEAAGDAVLGDTARQTA